MMASGGLQVVGSGEIPLYPIPSSARLDSHYFVAWNLRRWRGSDFRRLAYRDPEVGFFGRELFDLAQDETPVGTLPRDDEALAFLLRMPKSRWCDLKARPVSPLYGWYQVLTDADEVRLAHRVVTEIVQEALGRRDRNRARHADERMRKRLKTISGHLRDGVAGGASVAANEDFINNISDWIEAAYPGGSATLKRVKEALGALNSRF